MKPKRVSSLPLCLVSLTIIFSTASPKTNTCGPGCNRCAVNKDGSKYCSMCYNKKLIINRETQGTCEGEPMKGCLYEQSLRGVSSCAMCKPGMMLVTPKEGGAKTCEETPRGYNCGQGSKVWDRGKNNWSISCMYCKSGDHKTEEGTCAPSKDSKKRKVVNTL